MFKLFRKILIICAISIVVGSIFSFFIDNGSGYACHELRRQGLWALIIIGLLASNCQIRINHIESIKYHRKQRRFRVKSV